MRLGLLPGAAAVAFAAAGLVACGHGASGHGGHAQASPPVCRAHPALARIARQAATRAAAQRWVHFKINETGTGLDFTETGAGMGSGGTLVAGHALLTGLAGGRPHTVRLVLLNRRFYLQGPGLAGATPGKPWVTFPASSLTRPAMAGMRRLVQDAGFLRAPRDRVGVITLLGCSSRVSGARQEELGGVPTIRYRGLLPATPVTERDPTLRRLAAQGARSVTWALWVDTSGLPRRLLVTASISAYGHLSIDESFSGWGQPTPVTAPPPSQTVPVPAGNGSQPPTPGSA